MLLIVTLNLIHKICVNVDNTFYLHVNIRGKMWQVAVGTDYIKNNVLVVKYTPVSLENYDNKFYQYKNLA